MKSCKRIIASILALTILLGLCACAQDTQETGSALEETLAPTVTQNPVDPERLHIEETLNLANNKDQEWKCSGNAWVLTPVPAVAYPELPEQQGVSVCVPGAYVIGIDTNGDGKVDVTSADAKEAVRGALVIDYDAQITSPNGQVYTAATAPVILNTGAPGYGSQKNASASTTYAADGYINVSCGNRGKQDKATDANGNTYYTGDAPSCLVDQKAAARFVKYNILLGNLPGSVDHFVSTGGSGGGAHASMFAATSNHPDYYDYQIEVGAVGVYKNEDGSYCTTVTIDGVAYELSDGAWGCIAYSPITSLYEADMALAFEYYLDTEYSFKTPFQAKLAEYLSASYMEFINEKDLSVAENVVGFDLNSDDDIDDIIALTIEYDPETHPDTNGYYGSYLDLYLAEFTQNLQWYLDNLDYSEGWTWFGKNGTPLSNGTVAAMTSEDKAEAFLAGRYTPGSSGKKGGFGGRGDGVRGNGPVGTPNGGTTQSATGSGDSRSYATYEEMVAAYKADVAEVYAGDKYGKNIVMLYNPLNYIGAEGTENPTWTKLLMGAAEGDISMFNSLNLQLAWLNAGTDTVIEWQWNGGHVPSEILGESFALYVDLMYAKHVEGAVSVTKTDAVRQMENGTSEAPTGTNISGWINSEDLSAVSFTLADIAAYRTAAASKAMPAFDVIDYGQEDYVFGSAEKDARHWNTYLLEIFDEYADVLKPLFNSN